MHFTEREAHAKRTSMGMPAENSTGGVPSADLRAVVDGQHHFIAACLLQGLNLVHNHGPVGCRGRVEVSGWNSETGQRLGLSVTLARTLASPKSMMGLGTVRVRGRSRVP